MNIAVVDDNISFVKKFSTIINQKCKALNIKADIQQIYDGYLLIEKYKEFDLIFLDIEMPHIDGIEVSRQINELKGNNDTPFIVFVTNRDNLVFSALKQYPFSFIRKANFEEEVEQCILNVERKLEKQTIRYMVKDGRSSKFLNPDEIIYIVKDKNYVVFKTTDNEYRERSKIDDKIRGLSKFGFVRTHIGYIVNLRYVAEISNTEFTLHNGVKIPISKTYKKEAKEQYFDWMVKHND